MATIAVFRFPTETFVLGRIFETYPEATVEIERVIPTGAAVTPYFWVEGIRDEGVRSLLDSATGIDGVTLVDTFDGRSLIRCNCAGVHSTLFDVVEACDVSLLAAEGTIDGWTLTLRGDEKTALTAFDSASRDAGLAPTLADIHEVTDAPSGDTTPLTDPQREALQLAYRAGYYEEPRAATLAELAGELGISRQALASRLRRGYRGLIRAYVFDGQL